MTTLATFLEQRWQEAEADALAALGPSGYPLADTSWQETLTYAEGEGVSQAGLDHFARQNPAHVLADIASKRAIVGHLTTDEGRHGRESYWMVLRHFAAPYADHPDFRDEWALMQIH